MPARGKGSFRVLTHEDRVALDGHGEREGVSELKSSRVNDAGLVCLLCWIDADDDFVWAELLLLLRYLSLLGDILTSGRVSRASFKTG